MSFARWIGALALLLLVAAAVLLWTAPAALLLRWYADQLGPVQLQGVSGSLWQGRAEQVIAFGVALGPVDWQVEPGSVFAGQARGALTLSGSQVRASTRFARSAGQLQLDAIRAEFPAALLAPALDIPALSLLGRISVDAPEAQLREGLLYSARGKATWQDLGITGAANVRLPGVGIEFAPGADGTILAEVSDLGGPLAIDGEVRIRDGHFLSETRLNLREPNPPLEEALKFIGQRMPDGGSWLRVEGQLKSLAP